MTSPDAPLQPAPKAPAGSTPLPSQTISALLRAGESSWLLPGVFLALPLLWVIAYFFPPMNQDVGVILSVAERWMDGQRLYIDVIDVNPPLIFMLTLIPVALSKILPIASDAALMICVLAFCFWSAWASYRIMLALQVAEESAVKILLLPLLLFALVVFPSEMFAQREHLMAVGAFPYLLLAAARCEDKNVSGRLALAVAIASALGFALKPHFLIIPFAVELYLVCIRGPRRALRDPLPWIMALVWVAYLAAAWLVTPAYFTFVVPFVMDSYEHIGGTNYLDIILGRHLAPYLFLVIPLTIAAFAMRWPYAARITGIVAVAAAIAGVAQDKGWPYHLLPTQMMSILLFGWAVLRLMDRLQYSGAAAMQAGRSMVGLMLLMIYVLSAAVRYGLYDQMGYKDSDVGQWQRILEKHANGASVLMLTPGIYPHFPAMNYVNIKQASRFLTVWPLQGAYENCKADEPRYHTPAQMGYVERTYDKMLIEDLVKNKPRLVVIDKIPGIPWCGGEEFDFLEYFLKQPAFAAEWQNYEYVGAYDRYLLYKRTTGIPSTR
jgi:hypothetical protein